MSQNFLKYLKLFVTNAKLKFEPLVLVFVPSHLAYVISTEKTESIVVSSKYKYVQNGFTNFMIIDDKNNHYNVNNSYWFWKWDSIEDWYNLKIGDKINAQYYGIRIPFLGCFPNIVDTNYDMKNNKIVVDNSDVNSSTIDSSLITCSNIDNDRNYNDRNYNDRRKLITSALATFK